jgi:broad specificity phosphatase PhoE
MKSFCLIRHGESPSLGLSMRGKDQVRIASERWLALWDKSDVVAYHSPISRARESAEVFTQVTGIPSIEEDLLSIVHFFDRQKHALFADRVALQTAPLLVLIGHEETRRVCEALTTRIFQRPDRPPYLELGGMLRFVDAYGYELIL